VPLMLFDPRRQFDRLARESAAAARTICSILVGVLRQGERLVVALSPTTEAPSDLESESNVVDISAYRRCAQGIRKQSADR
jgi:hypothetical protein